MAGFGILKRAPGCRKDGTCQGPKCQKQVPASARAEGDPFCTTECCRRYYSVVFSSDTHKERTKSGYGNRYARA